VPGTFFYFIMGEQKANLPPGGYFEEKTRWS